MFVSIIKILVCNKKWTTFHLSICFLNNEVCDIVYYDVMISYLIHFIFFVKQHSNEISDKTYAAKCEQKEEKQFSLNNIINRKQLIKENIDKDNAFWFYSVLYVFHNQKDQIFSLRCTFFYFHVMWRNFQILIIVGISCYACPCFS